MNFFTAHLPSFAKSALLCLSLLFIPILSQAKDVTFTWAANPESVTGYNLYCKSGENSAPPYDGTGCIQGSAPLQLGNVTSYTVTGLLPNETYHFVLTAFNQAGESGYSAIATILPSLDPSPVIINMSAN